MVKMSSELVKSTSVMDRSNNNETISVRLARYLDRIRHLETKNTQNFLKEADTRAVKQQELQTKDVDELREQYETQLQWNREKLENLMKTKLNAEEMASQRDREALEHVLKTLSVTHNQINESESRLIALEQTKFTLTDTIRNLQTSLAIEQSQAKQLQTEINRLREGLASKIEQHQQIMDTEAEDSLTLEIAQFNRLLSQEEKRLKLSTSSEIHKRRDITKNEFKK